MSVSNVMSGSLISASNSMKVARIQNGIKKQMEDRAGVLEAEIKQEKGNAPEKKKELEKTEKKAAEVGGAAMDTLSEVNSTMKQAAKEDLEAAKEEKATEKEQREKTAAKRKEKQKAQEEILEKAAQNRNIDNTDDTNGNDKVAMPGSVNMVADSITPSSGTNDHLGMKVDFNA